VQYQKNKGWQLTADKPLVGATTPSRVSLGGHDDDEDPQRRVLARFKPMAAMTAKQGVPPEKVDVATGKVPGDGPVGFSALLPFLQDRDAQAAQRQRVWRITSR
jgi:endoglucanase